MFGLFERKNKNLKNLRLCPHSNYDDTLRHITKQILILLPFHLKEKQPVQTSHSKMR
jgi:hypothetical protein